MTKNDDAELAKKIARTIFECGDTAHDRVKRIAFKGGVYPHEETNLGGMNEDALTSAIHRTIVAERSRRRGEANNG